MGLSKFIAAKWVKALKCNQSFLQPQLSMKCYEMQSKTMWESLLNRCLIQFGFYLASKAKVKPAMNWFCWKFCVIWKLGGVTNPFILQGWFSSRHYKFLNMQASDVSCIFLGFCVLPSKRGCSAQTDLQNLLMGLKYQYANSEMSPMPRNWERSELLKCMTRLGPVQCWELKMVLEY